MSVMCEITNDLGLPYPKYQYNHGGKPLPVNKHKVNVKARELLQQTDYPMRKDQLLAVQLMDWVQIELGQHDPRQDPCETTVAVGQLLIFSEPKPALEYLLKERNLPNQEYTVKELIEDYYLPTDDPMIGGVVLLQLLENALGAWDKESGGMSLSKPPEEVLVMCYGMKHISM